MRKETANNLKMSSEGCRRDATLARGEGGYYAREQRVEAQASKSRKAAAAAAAQGFYETSSPWSFSHFLSCSSVITPVYLWSHHHYSTLTIASITPAQHTHFVLHIVVSFVGFVPEVAQKKREFRLSL